MWLKCLTSEKILVTLETTDAGTTAEVLTGDGTYEADSADAFYLVSPDTAGITEYRFTGTATQINSTNVMPAVGSTTSGWSNHQNARVNGGGFAQAFDADSTVTFSGYDLSIIFETATILGITVRLDAYKDADVLNALTLSARLSWDAGGNWTDPQETAILDTTESTLELGAVDDDWGHTWDPTATELDPTMFLVEVTTDGAVGGTGQTWYLDWCAVTVTYAIAVTGKTTDVTLVAIDGTETGPLTVADVAPAEAKV